FVCVASSIAVITMIFAVFLIVAGFSSSDSASVLDLFFGINLRDVSPHAPLGCTEERGRLTLTTEAFRRSFRKRRLHLSAYPALGRFDLRVDQTNEDLLE